MQVFKVYGGAAPQNAHSRRSRASAGLRHAARRDRVRRARSRPPAVRERAGRAARRQPHADPRGAPAPARGTARGHRAAARHVRDAHLQRPRSATRSSSARRSSAPPIRGAALRARDEDLAALEAIIRAPGRRSRGERLRPLLRPRRRASPPAVRPQRPRDRVVAEPSRQGPPQPHPAAQPARARLPDGDDLRAPGRRRRRRRRTTRTRPSKRCAITCGWCCRPCPPSGRSTPTTSRRRSRDDD